MKLLINSDFTYSETYNPSISDEDVFDNQEEVAELHKILDSLCVHHTITNHRSGMKLTLYVQKVCLDEVNMNTLFYDIIDRFFDYDIGYSWLGGAGGDFALNISKSLTP